MDELQRKHRQEQKDLQARTTQKKKSATKKTRKGVNDECAELERQLKERHDLEIAKFNGESEGNGLPEEHSADIATDGLHQEAVNGKGLEHDIQGLTISSSQPSKDELAKKPNRQKTRLARRAAEQQSMITQAAKEAEALPDLRKEESEAMRAQYTSRKLIEHEIRSDGHCLYAAIADQLSTLRLPLIPEPSENMCPINDPPIVPYKSTRVVAAAYIKHHSSDFEPFLEEPLEDYLLKIRYTGEWGGHLELLALARAYNVNIHVLQGSGHVEKILSGTDEVTRPVLWLAYYLHNFGLGEHYNSLRPAN
ncbi:MAG: hypothetical protein LQ346_001880 [Caloplaca aetnensis]|nr:MAG: hypothetical protein LQ346_001880 [Caloplaca aetnensis]